MINEDESALICDLAETYHIYDYRSLPARLVATLSCGLRDDSRIKMKIRGIKTSEQNILLAIIADRIGALACGLAGKKAPKSIADEYFIKDNTRKEDFVVFESPEAFDEARRRILEGG